MNDFDGLAFMGEGVRNACVAEVYSGEGIVGWFGNIERQLDRMVVTYDAARNDNYTTKLNAYLRIWREHPLTGSINVEAIDALLGATEVLAVDGWQLKNYFSNLRDQLRRLKASEEELPRGDSSGGLGGGSLGPGPTPPSGPMGQELGTEFGPDADNLEKPNEMDLPPKPGEDDPNNLKKPVFSKS